ncbi:uncharacterized protein LOC108458890 [Gossypium arboreum]|uniref:uncharacterized protein LOC108458890 n=1 Tax=Gossypium arboreum TaxID=29729 RepID=UPI00081905B7|nr:uncharacterized protein LOC108458890 [Gossypium arboreum]
MLQILERVTRPNTGSRGRRSVTERLWSNGTELFRGIAGVAPNVAEYWMEATELIMDNLDFTTEQKLKGVVSLLCDEVYQWWLMVKEGTQADWLTWDLFKTAFKRKYVGSGYIDGQSREFLNLTQRDRSMAEYEVELQRLSRYARGMVATDIRVLIAPQKERDFSALVEKAKITEEVKPIERQNRDRGKAKKDAEPSNSMTRPRKKARSDGPVKVGPTVASTRVAICHHYNRRHPSECWRATGACLRCGSTEHHVKDCLLRTNQMQAPTIETAQPLRGRG